SNLRGGGMRSVLLTLWLVGGSVLAQSATPLRLTGTTLPVNNGPGDQTDPHVSQTTVAYTNLTSTGSEIRYHELGSGTDLAVPSTGGIDFLSDVSGDTIV